MHIRKRKRLLRYKSIVFIVTIVALSSMGVGYGAWDESLNIDISISTGRLDPQFTGYEFRIENGEGDICINQTGKNIDIQGWCTPGATGVITAYVTNRGTIPVKSDETGIILPSETRTYTINFEPEYNRNQSIDSLQVNYDNFDIDSIMEELYPEEVYIIDEEIQFEQYTNP